MQEPKTKPTKENVTDFLNKIEPAGKKHDSFELLNLFEKITTEKPVMWGPSIVGFGKYLLKYSDGNEAYWPMAGFSPRKQNLTLYILINHEKVRQLLKSLGRHKTSKACLYINKLSDIDMKVLSEIIKTSITETRKKAKLSSNEIK